MIEWALNPDVATLGLKLQRVNWLENEANSPVPDLRLKNIFNKIGQPKYKLRKNRGDCKNHEVPDNERY